MFDHRSKDTSDPIVFGPNRAEREREVTFLWKAVSFQHEQLVVRPSRFTSCDDTLEHGPDDVPDFHPDVATAPSERLRMLTAQDLGVSVVVQHNELGTPEDHDGKA
jgi:hypothetical protein